MSKLAPTHQQILGVYVDSIRASSVLNQARIALAKKKKLFIITPNPEIVLLAQQDQKYKQILNSADIAICDGIGLNFASRFLYGKPLHRLAGRSLFRNLLQFAHEKHLKIYLLGSTLEVMQKSLQKIKKQYPDILVNGASGPAYDNSASPVTKNDEKLETDIISEINTFRPDMLFVALGAPKQEIWIAKWLPKIHAKVFMGVGGTLDTFSESVSQPPTIFADLGLEWIWRLIAQPQRIGRIFNAVVTFPLAVLREKLEKD